MTRNFIPATTYHAQHTYTKLMRIEHSQLRNRHLSTTLATIALLVTISTMGQSKLVDRRDQAEGWYVPLHGRVLVDGKSTDGYVVHLFKDNQEVGEIASDKKGRFELELDLDQSYTIEFVKEGFVKKYIYLDTTLPKELVQYPSYECTVGLEKKAASNVDPFYRDFPSAIIRYNAELGGFTHSEHYYTHIQTKLVGYANAGK